METLLLPGMDGTGRLFGSFENALHPDVRPHVVSYPLQEPLSYDELLDEVSIPRGPFSIVAESFSGPLGIRLAERYTSRVRALILVASFCRSPSAFAGRLARLAHERLFRLPVPDVALRMGLLGMDAPRGDVASVRAAIAAVEPVVLAERLRQISTVDVRDTFRRIDVPVLYMAGVRDRLVRRRTVAEMRRLRPDMATIVLDAPHLVLQRRPAEAARRVSEFLLQDPGGLDESKATG